MLQRVEVTNNTTLRNIIYRACKSIQVDVPRLSVDTFKLLPEVSKSEGYKGGRGGKSWYQRAEVWGRSPDCTFLCWTDDQLYVTKSVKDLKGINFLPVFKSYGNLFDAVRLSAVPKNNETNKQESNQMKDLFNRVVDTNKDSAVLAAKLTAGKTANDFIQSKLHKSLPWYAKLFRSNTKKNPLAKLATANLAVLLTQHFAQHDKRLKFISEAMLQDAMVAMSRDSDMLEKFITEITDAVAIPDSVLEKFNKEQDS
jgi:hypothetical protein